MRLPPCTALVCLVRVSLGFVFFFQWDEIIAYESSHMIQSHRVSDQAQLVPKSYCISLAQRGQGDPYTVRRSALACPHAAASTRETGKILTRFR